MTWPSPPLCPRCGGYLQVDDIGQADCDHCGGHWQADQALAELRRWHARRSRARPVDGHPPVTVVAWLVSEGDIGPDGRTVAAVYREVVCGRVRIIWSDGHTLNAAAEAQVHLRCRPLAHATGPRPRRAEAARMWLARALAP